MGFGWRTCNQLEQKILQCSGTAAPGLCETKPGSSGQGVRRWQHWDALSLSQHSWSQRCPCFAPFSRLCCVDESLILPKGIMGSLPSGSYRSSLSGAH